METEAQWDATRSRGHLVHVFVCFDLISFLIQIRGCNTPTAKAQTYTTGRMVSDASLILLVIIGLFVCLKGFSQFQVRSSYPIQPSRMLHHTEDHQSVNVPLQPRCRRI